MLLILHLKDKLYGTLKGTGYIHSQCTNHIGSQPALAHPSPHKLSTVQFSSFQFIQFHQIHYKSKRPTGYRISHSTIYIYRYNFFVIVC